MDLFNQNDRTIAIHRASKTAVIVKHPVWISGEMHYDCLVPQKDDKGKAVFCHATYSEQEISITQIRI